MASGSRHWVPAKQRNESFPFSYDISVVELGNFELTDSIDFFNGDNLKEIIRDKSLKYFNFYEYLDEYNYDENKLSELKMYFSVDFFYIDEAKKGKDRIIKSGTDTQYIMLSNFKSEYRFTLIDSLEKLKDKLSDIKVMAFDTETTGLDPSSDDIVGISFSKESRKGYYVPIKHSDIYNEFNLGNEAISLVYNAMVNANLVFMFNSRFDMRMVEFSENDYDMSKVNMMDVQINAYFADPGYPDHSLKHLEKHFLGYYRPDLQDTLKGSGVDSFNTALINPKNILFYAAQDSISTLEMGYETYQYYEEFGVSGQIDQMILYPLMKMENTEIRIDIDYLESELTDITKRLDELNKEITADIGDVNLNSSKQKIELFKSFGLDTGKTTPTGNMATGKDEIEELIKKLESQGKKYPKWLGLLNERARLEKLQSAFFTSLLEQAKLHDGKIRINYRHGNTSTGRFSSGEEKEY